MKHRSFSLCILTALACLAFACSPARERTAVREIDNTKTETPIPRADPGFLQYLEKKSMLGNAAEMAKIVSGSHLGWQSSPGAVRSDQLLQHADIWVAINPLMLLVEARRNAFDYLSDSRFWAVMREAGIKGLYVAPTGGTGRLWAMNKESMRPETGEDVVQYDFSDVAGNEKSYRYMMGKILDEHAALGSDLVPAATGLGPDFFLAARNIRDYPGAYCLVEIPKEMWGILPDVGNEWDGVAIADETAKELSAKGILPKAMLRDIVVAGGRTGWAATAEITGVGGNPRRWIYRYYNDPSQPILNWEDPSKAASRILSGSAVRQVGMLGQVLIGMRFDAFRGLDPSASGLGPALSASQTMSNEINRYGGWSWLRDRDLTVEGMRRFLNAGADFVLDNALSPGAEHALLTGDTALLRYMADKLVASGIESSRLVHAMPSYDGISYSLTTLKNDAAKGDKTASSLLSSVLGQLSAAVAGQGYMPVKNQVLYTTSTGLAAMALNMPGDAVTGKGIEDVAKGHSLLVFFKAMQPGLLLLSGQDLVGAMPLGPGAMAGTGEWDASYASRGTYSLTPGSGTFVRSGQSIPRTQNAYAPADDQVMDKNSFLHRTGIFLRKRTEVGLATGRLVGRPATKGQGSIALLSRLQNGAHVLTVCNFSRASVTESITLSGGPNMGTRSAIGGQGTFSVSGSTVTVSLGPWQGKAVLLGRAGKSSQVEEEDTGIITDPAQGMYPDERQTDQPAAVSNVESKPVPDAQGPEAQTPPTTMERQKSVEVEKVQTEATVEETVEEKPTQTPRPVLFQKSAAKGQTEVTFKRTPITAPKNE